MQISPGRWVLAVALAVTLSACGSGGGAATGGGGGGGGGGGNAGTVNGIITDIGTGAHLAAVAVTGGGQSATTDAKGEYTLTGLAAGAVNLTFSKSGYAPGYATATAGTAAVAVVTRLKQQGSPQAYVATQIRTLSQRTEAGPYAVIFAPNSLDTSDTNLQVSITPLDPTKEREALPGTLVSGGATPSILLPVTFAEFTITDSTGRRVNLKPSASAQVELPIPPSLRSTYPTGTKIHCYAYDSTTGKWEDFVEGTVQTSTVDGTSPVLAASIRHFSWYGGAPQGNDCVDVYVNVVSAVDGKPLPNARVEATPGTSAYTDVNGSALITSAIGSPGSTYTAYQTGFDVDGSLTGIPGAKYIEFGKVEEDLVGLVRKPCSGAGLLASAVTAAPGTTALRGTASDPLTIKVGVVKNLLYEATAILIGGAGGAVSVTLAQGVPGPDGALQNPLPADGAKVYIAEAGGTQVALTGLGQGSGTYYSSSLVITPGRAYTLSIDGDGNGSIDGSGTAFAVGTLAWATPAEGATVPATTFTASWTDSGSAAGGAAYAPVYEVAMTQESATGTADFALYLGTDRQFSPRSAYSTSVPPAPLAPGSYTASLLAFSGAYSSASGSFTIPNNITGVGVTGVFLSFGSGPSVSFTVQ